MRRFNFADLDAATRSDDGASRWEGLDAESAAAPAPRPVLRVSVDVLAPSHHAPSHNAPAPAWRPGLALALRD